MERLRHVVEAEFLAAVQIQRLGEQPEPKATIEPIEAAGGRGVCIRVGDRTHLILFRKAGADGLLRGGGLETDGQTAAVEFAQDGNLARAMVVGAKRLLYHGRALLDADKPQDWSSDSSTRKG